MSAQRNGKKTAASSSGAGGDSTLLPLALAVLVLISALCVVQVKHRHRTLTTQLEQLRNERERLELEWAQLQLEEATLAQHGRVDLLARTQFDMVDPRDYRIVEAGQITAAGRSAEGAAVGAGFMPVTPP